MFALYIFCGFLLAGPLHLMSLLLFLGIAADAQRHHCSKNALMLGIFYVC